MFCLADLQTSSFPDQKNISLWNARSGGLATISKKPLPIHEIQSSEYPFTTGRCTQTWVPSGCGRRGFHIFNIYGHVGAGSRNPEALRLNEQLLTSVFEAAAKLGDVPWILV